MKLRSGRYGIYKGKEYRVVKSKESIEIIIDDPDFEIPEGFYEEKKYGGGVMYCKQVRKEELEEVYKIRTYAVYLGKKRSIAGNIVDGKIALDGDESEMGYGFENHGKGEFVKIGIPVSEVDEFIEEKEPYDLKYL